MRILYIVPYTPSLIRVRPYQMIRALARRGHQITVGALWSSRKEHSTLMDLACQSVQIAACRLPAGRSLWNCLLALPSRTPLQAVFSWQPGLAEKIRETLGESHYDVIHCEHLRGARFGLLAKKYRQTGGSQIGPGVPEGPPPVVWDSVDCISHLFEQAKSQSLSRKGRWMTGLELGRTRAYESWLLEQFDRVLVTSRDDREALLKLRQGVAVDPSSGQKSESNVLVLPNGVDLKYFEPGRLLRDDRTLVFTGKMSYHANVTAVLYLIREVMPRVWAKRPEVRLEIVGKDPPREIRDLTKPSGNDGKRKDRVIVTGTVPDIRPYLWKATLSVVPLTYGAGIQNKVLEAMACGTPVITSPRAVAALEVRAREDLLVADGPEAFASAILELLEKAVVRDALSVAGRRYVEKHHDWDEIGGRLESVYEQAIRVRNQDGASAMPHSLAS